MLDQAKRTQLIALLAAGLSRRRATKLVGCARSTLYRLVERDPEFAGCVARAETSRQNTKDTDARQVFPTLHQPANWRAAAWVLERINPQDFGPREPEYFCLRGAAEMLGEFVDMLREELPQDACRLVVRQINQLLASYDAAYVPQLDEDPEPADDEAACTDQETERRCSRAPIPEELERLVPLPDPGPWLVDSPEFLAIGPAPLPELEGELIAWDELYQNAAIDQVAALPDAACSLPERIAQLDEPASVAWLGGDVLRHSSMELASYGHPSRSKSLLLLQLGMSEKFNIFGHTQWRRARKNKRTAHGGKAAVAASLSGADRRDAYGWTGRQDVSPTNSRRSRLHLSICVSRMHLFFGSFVGVSTNRHAVLPEGLFILHPSSFILHPSSFVLRPPLSRLGSPGALFRGKIGKARVEQTEERN